ncbi:carboxypeptidase regulatory-like domain-containing protein [Streptomyces sp. NPDC048409]|uniref:carboxypeptidase regulatory-like domain-containing protein n=1 Tax=Streptomyces sp. NPDC048409 TaxID=3154723 RepID=UPI0034198354
MPRRLGVVASVVTALLGAGLPLAAAASAEPAAEASAQPSQASVESVESVCSAPKPGHVGCFALRRTDTVARHGVSATDPVGYGPSDLQSAYALPAGGGAGRTVAVVVAYDDPTAEADLAVYREQYGLPECTADNGCFRKVDQRGGTDFPQPNSSWAAEASLDLDMVSASAPAAHLLLVEADSSDFQDMFAAVDQAVAQGAQYVSNSYGSDYTSQAGSGELAEEATEFDAHYNRPGVAMVASTGDRGYGVSYPAASQYVTAVGGTTLNPSATASRGWTESAWGLAGSGCSLYEPKPGFQTDTGCANRSVADVAAVANPLTGVAFYQTYGGNGWGEMGGTSAAAPIIAGVYAAAAVPDAGTYPNAYPYFKKSELNDVTSGINGICTPAYLCSAGTGYDGPTGLGTPNGLAAFRNYPHGTVSGTVTDSSGAPLTTATVTADGYQATVDAHGHYSLTLPAGSHDLRADAYGYRSGTVSGVTVADRDSITRDITLEAAPSQTVTGRITDGSGHGYPLYAAVTAEDVPGAPVFTDPYTGVYKLRLPEGRDYTLKVVAQYPGYQTGTKDVTVGSSTRKADVALPVDREVDTFAGYDVGTVGRTEAFDATDSPPDGWTVVNAPGTEGGWQFSDPTHQGNKTDGSGGFALANSISYAGKRQDSTLLSPVYDFSGYTRPRISFDMAYPASATQSATVDITTDGGATWTNLRTWTKVSQTDHIDIPVAAYSGAKAVQVRFRYVASNDNYWELDNLFIGDRPATPVKGGLVAGVVTDANTGADVLNARVRDADDHGQTALTTATPADPRLDDGFYWLFSDSPGKRSFAVTKSKFATATKTVRVVPDGVTEADQTLQSGRLTVRQAAVDKTLTLGGKATTKLTIKNTGKAPATFTVAEQVGTPESQTVDGTAWQSVADLPTATTDNAVAAYDGRLYSAFGYTPSTNTYSRDMYVYDPGTDAWSQLAPAADERDAPAKGFIDGKFYAVGGWRNDSSLDPTLEVYDPGSDTWSTGASIPKPYAGSASAVLDGKLYVVGGCGQKNCLNTDVYAYDPTADKWSAMAPYPIPVGWAACGEIDDKLYCAGGQTVNAAATKHAYVYDPVTDSWSPIADMSLAVWAPNYAAANGQLVIVGGRAAAGVTNKSSAYDPRSGTWTALPNAASSIYRGGAAPGFYSVGGMRSPGGSVTAMASVLPGYDQGDRTDDVTWLGLGGRQATLRPGASTTVTVSLDATSSGVGQPGVYTAQVSMRTDTPYHVAPVPVTMTVDPPKGWARYAGTVLGDDGEGGTAPLAGATVEIVGKKSSHTLTTAEDGTCSVWLDTRGGPITVTVSMEGYEPETTRLDLSKKGSAPGDFTLKKAP